MEARLRVECDFHFVVFAAIAVPRYSMGFLTYDPSLARLRSLPIAVVGILFFTAWPEEFLFRGVLQNLFSRTLKNQWAGLPWHPSFSASRTSFMRHFRIGSM